MIKSLIQQSLAFLLLLACFAPVALSADAKKVASPPPAKIEAKPLKTPEQYYLDGAACLNFADTACAQVALASLNPTSAYAKLLQGQIAAANVDFDTALRLLIPLQVEKNLPPQALASLHATLARAYEQQQNPLRALEQYVKTAESSENPVANEMQLWHLVSAQPKEVLLEIRGEGSDPTIQGWVDLALAASYAERRERNIEQWRSAYPQHPASKDLLTSIVASAGVAKEKNIAVNGSIALLLPLESPVYGNAAQAVQAGFMAALTVDGANNANTPQVQVYPTGTAEQTRAAYAKAVADGATWVVGPLTRDEVSSVLVGRITIPTLVLNLPENEIKTQEHLTLFGLSAENEARQIAQMVRDRGLQTAQVVVADTPLGKRVAKAFMEEWKALQGSVTIELTVTKFTNPEPARLAELKATSLANSADMIFLAANAAQARLVRPYLDTATPTYSTSHVYDGASKGLQNLDLIAIHFVDMPWILETNSHEFSNYRSAAAQFKGAELQRLFALGLDAYKLLSRLQGQTVGKTVLEGATGEIIFGATSLMRELPLAQFRRDGVALEDAP
jgi:uncharacterized protein